MAATGRAKFFASHRKRVIQGSRVLLRFSVNKMTDKKGEKKKNSAEELIKQAEERLKARFIGTKNKHEDAVKLYIQAAALYKMEGDCECLKRCANSFQSFLCLNGAVVCGVGSEAGEVLVKAAAIRETKVRFCCAGCCVLRAKTLFGVVRHRFPTTTSRSCTWRPRSATPTVTPKVSDPDCQPCARAYS